MLWHLSQDPSLDFSSIKPPLLFAMFLSRTNRLAEVLQRGGSNNTDKDAILKPLLAAANRGYQPSQAILPLVCRSLEYELPEVVQKNELRWLWEAVASGSLGGGAELKILNREAYDNAKYVFEARGVYCWFYDFFDFMAYSQPTYVKSSRSSERIDKYGNYALHYKACFGNPREMEQALGSSQVDVNTQNFKGQTALYVACCRGSWPVAQVLLNQGADPSIPDTTSGNTCLHWICTWNESCQSIFARTLMERGANLDALNTDDLVMFHYPFVFPRGSPLHWAVATFQHSAIKCLLNLGASPSIRNGSDPYLYDFRIRRPNAFGGPEMEQWSNPENPTLGVSPIDLAVMERDSYLLQQLIQTGISYKVNDVDEQGCAAFHRLDSGHVRRTRSGIIFNQRAFWGGQEERERNLATVIQSLLQLGGNINQLTRSKLIRHGEILEGGKTPLMLALCVNELETVRQLLKYNADVNARNEIGENVLFYFDCHPSRVQEAICKEAAELLLYHGADVHCKRNSGTTPISSIPSQILDVVKLLLDNGADVEEKNPTQRNMTVLAKLASAEDSFTPNHDERLAIILAKSLFAITDREKRNLVMNCAGNSGRSLLHYMTFAGLHQCILTLLQAGADVNRVQKDSERSPGFKPFKKMTPLDEAIFYRDKKYDILENKKSSGRSRKGK